MKRLSTPLILLVAVFFMACAKKNTPSVTTEPAKPVANATKFTVSVQPLLQAKCSPCHIPSKGGRKADFDSYASAVKYGAEMITRIEKNTTDRGFMPFKNAKLSTDEIAVIKKWVSDGMVEK